VVAISAYYSRDAARGIILEGKEIKPQDPSLPDEHIASVRKTFHRSLDNPFHISAFCKSGV
jgi:hypothetical protein